MVFNLDNRIGRLERQLEMALNSIYTYLFIIIIKKNNNILD